MLAIQATPHVTQGLLSSPPLPEPVRSTASSTQSARNDIIKKSISAFLDRMGYQRGAEPVILDTTLEETVLADIKAKGIEVEERKSKEMARLGAAMANVGHTS
jgi:hypothetical protein